MALLKCPCVHFDCAGSHKRCVAELGSGIFLVNFQRQNGSSQMSMCAFRLCRLAQKVCRRIGVRHFSCKFPTTKWLFSNVHVCIDCAGSHKRCVAELGSGIFLVNFQRQNGSSQMSMCAFRLCRLAQRCVAELGSGIFLQISTQNGSCEMPMCISTAQARTKWWPRNWGCMLGLNSGRERQL